MIRNIAAATAIWSAQIRWQVGSQSVPGCSFHVREIRLDHLLGRTAAVYDGARHRCSIMC